MTRSGGKIPFPMPSTGVEKDKHPFALGPSGLVKSQNWLLIDGRLRTRDGLIAMDPPKMWFEQITIEENLLPDGMAEGSSAGLAMFTNSGGAGTLSLASDPPIVGDAQYNASADGSTAAEFRSDKIAAEAGLDYTWWMLGSAAFTESTAAMEFLDSSEELIEAVPFTGDFISQGVVTASQFAPPGTAWVQLLVIAEAGSPVDFGPMKLVQGTVIQAWSRGDGYAGGEDNNLFDLEVAHPEDSQVAMDYWGGIAGREQVESYQGGGILGLFDDKTTQPILGRAVAFAAQTIKQDPITTDTVGIELNPAYRYTTTAYQDFRISASASFDVEPGPIFGIVFTVEAVCYGKEGAVLQTDEIVTATTPITGDVTVNDIGTPERGSVDFTTPYGTTAVGLRVKCEYPTLDQREIYTTTGEPVLNNLLQQVTVYAENTTLKRLAAILEDVKLTVFPSTSSEWYDFNIPVLEHDGPYARGEYPLNYLLHNYIFEGATEPDRIVMASDQSLWKFNDDSDGWEWIGFDLGTIYTAFYQVIEDEDSEEESFTRDDRFLFEETGDEGYTSDGTEDEPDELTVEIELPAAAEDSTEPYPGGWWRYRINGGAWSTKKILTGDDPVVDAEIEFNSRKLPIKIVLDVTDYEDFSDICTIPEGETLDNPIIRGTIVSRKHDGQAGETTFTTNRDDPVDLRGYDYGQKTYIIAANTNDRVVAWDGQDGSKIERSGSNAPFARTICVSGGRVLAGNVRFDDPYTDLIAPLAVVYTDTYLSRGFKYWHPELAIRLADTSGEIVKLLEMGTLTVAAYKSDALYMLVYQTGNNPFRTQLMASGVPGPLSVRSVAAVSENTHLYIGEDGNAYLFDGSFPRVISPSIGATIESELDLTYKKRAFLVYTPRLNAALAMYPTKGSEGRINRGMYIDMASQAGWPFEWGDPIFDFSASAPIRAVMPFKMSGMAIRVGNALGTLSSGQGLQPDFFMGALDGTTYIMDDGAKNDWGKAILAVLRSGLSEFGNQDRYSVLKEIEFIFDRANQPHSVETEVWASDYGLDARPVSHETINIFADGPYEAEVREKARFWGYGLKVDALEQIKYSGAFAAIAAAGRRKS